MIPFLLDDVARLHYDDMLRDFEARQRMNEAAQSLKTRGLTRRIRARTGQFFIAVGTCHARTGAMTPTVLQDPTS